MAFRMFAQIVKIGLLFCCALALFNCTKPTLVHGKVREMGTESPIEGALVMIGNNEAGVIRTEYTNADGEFSLDFDRDPKVYIFVSIASEKHFNPNAYKYALLIEGEANIMNVEFPPLAYLKFHIKNFLNTVRIEVHSDERNIWLTNKLRINNSIVIDAPASSDSTYSQALRINGAGKTKFTWRYWIQGIGYKEFSDSINCFKSGDTLSYYLESF